DRPAAVRGPAAPTSESQDGSARDPTAQPFDRRPRWVSGLRRSCLAFSDPEPLLHPLAGGIPNWLRPKLPPNLGGKSQGQHLAGGWLGKAPGLEVEQSQLIEISDGGAVRTLHVVGKDLELRLGVELGGVGEQQCPIGLFGVGLLSRLTDQNL